MVLFEFQIAPSWPLLGSIRHIPSCVTVSDVLCSDECQTKRAFQYVKRMLPLFCVVVKLCTTNRLFKYPVCNFPSSYILAYFSIIDVLIHLFSFVINFIISFIKSSQCEHLINS